MNTKEGRKLLRILLDFGNLNGYHGARLFTDKLADPKLRRVSAYVNGTSLQIKSLVGALELAGAKNVTYRPRGPYRHSGAPHIRMTCKWEG